MRMQIKIPNIAINTSIHQMYINKPVYFGLDNPIKYSEACIKFLEKLDANFEKWG